MTYDRDEWRRPWTVDDAVDNPRRAAATETATAAGHVAETATAAGHATETATAAGHAPWAASVVGQVTDRAPSSHERPSSPTGQSSDPSPSFASSRAPTSHAPSSHDPTSHASYAPTSHDPMSYAPTSYAPSSAPRPAASAPASPEAAPTASTGPAAAGRSRPRIVTIALTAFASAAIGVVATLAVTGGFDATSPTPPAAPPVSSPTVEIDTDARGIVPAVAEAVTPSVVRIDVSAGGAGPIGNGAIGSGVIYRSDGYILTNHHVVQPALENNLEVTVRLASGDVVEAEIVGSDELNDLAVVRIDRTGLPAVSLRPSDEPLQVGETVVAIGSPFGLDASVTAGIISALNREIRVDEQFGAGLVIPSVIQTDAAINPGNSGGALVDDQGRLIGINTAILTRSGASQGVGFAVSVEQAISSADQLIADGFVRHPLLGVTGVDVTPEVAEQFGLAASRGAVIESVQPDTGADDADLRPGDIIVAVDGEPLATMSQLVAEVRARAPGDVVVLTVVRGGEEIEVAVTLSERPR